jgi:drug/metabolite transporter (DMT)-like permease
MQKSPSSLTASSTYSFAGVVCVLVSAIGFSAKAIFIKLAYGHGVDAVTLLALRMLFSLPVFLGFALRDVRDCTVRTLSGVWVQVTVLGLLGYYLASYLDFLGLQYISAGLERLILFLYPTMVLILGAYAFERRIGRGSWYAIALSYSGIALVFTRDLGLVNNGIVLGSLFVFGSALAYAIYLLGSEDLIAKLGTIKFTAYAMSVSCFACILQFALTHPFSALRQPGVVYGYGLAMAFFSTVLPAFLVSEGIRRIGAGRAALIATVGPVSTIILAHVFLNETITLTQMLGTLLVIAGVVMVTRAP